MDQAHDLQSLAESLTEALEDEAPISRSIPKDDATPMAAALTVPPQPQLSTTVVTAQAMPTSPVASSTVVETLPNVDVESTDTIDQPTPTPNVASPSLGENAVKADRPSLGDWMGSWWIKPRSKSRVPHVPFPADDTPEPQKALTSPSIANKPLPADDTPPTPSVPPTPRVDQAPTKRKPSRSVFGTLGFSILNPASSSSNALIAKKRRNLSVTDISSPDPAEHSDASSAKAALVSPVSSPLLAASPALPEPTNAPSLSNGDSQSLMSHDEKPPQAATVRAIIQATRVMTSDASSILADQGRETSTLIAQLALELVRNARESGLDFRDRPKEKKERKPGGTERRDPRLSLVVDTDATPTPSRILSPGQAGRPMPKARKPSVNLPSFASPLFGSFAIQPQKKPITGPENGQQNSASEAAQSSSSAAASQSASKPKAGSVPLESIIPVNAKPPTQYLSRHYTPLTARDFHFSIPLPDDASSLAAQRDERSHEGFTDRFGFIYDIARYDALLLIRAKECKNTAPACLTGIKVADRTEDNTWPEDEEDVTAHTIDIVKDACDCTADGDDGADAISVNSTSTRPTVRSMPTGDSLTSARSRGASPASSRRTKRTSTLLSGASVATIKSTSSVLSVDDDTPHHICGNTIRRLLLQLTDIHDQRQAAQRKEWDLFLKNRSKAAANKSLSSASRNASFGVVGGAAQLLGLGTADEAEELEHSEGLIGFAQFGLSSSREEKKEFDRLVRNGIPLAYRSKAWLECSGALEMREPGVFTDLLAECDVTSSVVREIDKDVCRTMPLNIFFGRTGAGVEKLRRVLMAYSK